MADPFNIEKQFQTLRQSLVLIASPRLRLQRIVDFVDTVCAGEDSPFLPAYVPELLASFCPIALKCDLAGTPLAFVRKLIRFSESMDNQFSDIAEGVEWTAVLQHLKDEEKRILTWLETRKGTGRSELLLSEEAGYDAVWVPLVETELFMDVGHNQFGTLRQLHIRGIPNAQGNGQDELHFGQSTGKDGRSREEFLPGISAAKSFLRLCVGEQGNVPLVVQGWFDGSQTVSGVSVQAGLALALFTEQLHVRGHHEQYTVYNSTAITGSVEHSGKLLPVDPDGLRAKIEACTFSWIKRVVVPEEQAEIARFYAREAISSLDLEPVEVVGAHSIDDVLANRRLTGLLRIPWYTRTAMQVWEKRLQIAVVLILLLVLILARTWHGPIDREPTEALLQQNYLIVKNAHGDVLADFLPGDPGNKQSFSNLIQPSLIDVDADGSKEVIYGLLSSNGLFIVQCRSVFGDKIRWTVELKRHLVFPTQSGTEKENFKLQRLLTGDFDGDGKVEVICVILHDLFPCLVLKLEGSTGREISAYLHVGHLNSIVAVDLDGDQRREIVLCGVNNALRNACLVVLDPRHIEGCSPLTPDYSVEGWKPAFHRAYVRIPKTVIAEAFSWIVKWNLAGNINVSESERKITVNLRDQTIVDGYIADLYLDVDFGMRPISFYTGDAYDMTAERMVAEGLLSRKPDRKYFDELRSKVIDWDGKGWKSAMRKDGTSNLLPAVD